MTGATQPKYVKLIRLFVTVVMMCLYTARLSASGAGIRSHEFARNEGTGNPPVSILLKTVLFSPPTLIGKFGFLSSRIEESAVAADFRPSPDAFRVVSCISSDCFRHPLWMMLPETARCISAYFKVSLRMASLPSQPSYLLLFLLFIGFHGRSLSSLTPISQRRNLCRKPRS